MTRAREELYLMCATSRMLFGGVQHNPPSRFLSEIDANFQADTGSFGFNQSHSGGMFESFERNSYRNTPPPGMLGTPKEPVDDGPRYVPDLDEGDVVRHQVFGQGTIVELDGEVATIYFKGKGAKKLNISFAPLEKL
jgi:DNA helicase-2/ATP-dependent DNA helicase PcrA